MFSGNNRISERQAFRLLTYDLLGLSTLLVPPVLGKVAGRDGIFCIAAGVLAGILYLHILRVVAEDCNTSFPSYLEQKLGKLLGKVVQGGFFVYLVLLAGYTAYVFSDVVLESLLREESFYLVLIILLLLVIYGLWGGLEGRARVYEILFWFLMVPLFLMLFFALDEIKVDYWSPVATSDAGDILAGSYSVFLCMAIVFLVLFLGGYVEKKERLFAVGRRALLFTGGVHEVLYLVLLGIFGADALGTMEYPAVTLMSTVKISGGFLKRTDAFMFGVWFFTLYALLASCMFYSGKLLVQMFGKCLAKYGEEKSEHGVAVAVVLLVGVIACCFYRERAWMEKCEGFLWYIGTPFIVLVPVLLAVRKCWAKNAVRRVGRGIGMLAVTLLVGSVLTGCTGAELEDRNFPIEIAVQDTGDFTQEFLDTQGAGNRLVDYSHLKVMILSREFVEDEAAMQELLQFLESRNEIPHNTYVVVADDTAEILDMQEALGESVGNYLEQMFENVSQVKAQEYPTLGMLYQEYDNRAETLFIPYVSAKEDSLTVDSYYVWRRGEAYGSADAKTALLSFFTQNGMEEYQVTLENGAVVSLSDAHNKIIFEEEGGAKTVSVQMKCSGEVINQGVLEEKERKELTEQLEAYMNAIAERTLADKQIDVTDSFRKLGSKRDWYFAYSKQPELYEQDIQVNYELSVDWINL